MMITFEKIYDKAPIWFQNIMVSAKGYLNNRSRYGKEYASYRQFLKEFDTWTLEKRIAYQNDELVKFVHYAYKNSKFYKTFYHNVDINTIQTVEDLKKLPVLEKETLRQNINDIMIRNDEKWLYSYTGGTTGKPLRVVMTHKDMMHRMAMLDHFKERVGFKHREMRRATFNGKHIVPPKQQKMCFWRYNLACKQKIYSSFHMTEENMKYYVEDLNRFKPQALDGFFTSMCDIARYIESHNITLEFKPIAIFPTSETLTEEGRILLERVFDSKVYNQYASSEGAPFVNECIDQTLHVELASGVFEDYGEDNEVLVTSFSTYGTPLIRYRIGDKMVFDHASSCTCGNQALIVEKIEGRTRDFLYTAEGRKIWAVNSIIKGLPNNVIRSQFVQYIREEVILLLEVDTSRYSDEYEESINCEFSHVFGENTKLIIQYVDNIPREISGKFCMIKNNIKE